MQTAYYLTWFFPGFLVFCGAMGLLALVSPRYFARVATWSSQWIDSKKLLDLLDRRFDVDSRILPHARILGVLVLAAVSVLAYVYIHR